MFFLRSEKYMKYSQTSRHFVFYDHDGREVEVIHAFPLKDRESVRQFAEKNSELSYRLVQPPNGWHIYALEWGAVQDFVSGMSNKAPTPIRYNPKRHGAQLCEVRACHCGSQNCTMASSYETVVLHYQAVFFPVPIKLVRGRRAKKIRQFEEAFVVDLEQGLIGRIPV